METSTIFISIILFVLFIYFIGIPLARNQSFLQEQRKQSIERLKKITEK